MCGRFGGRKSTKNRSKIYPKGDRKQYESWDGFWMALGSIFGGFWAEVGGQVGAKLGPKSEEIGYQDDVKKNNQKTYAVFLPKKATRRIGKIAVPLIFWGGCLPIRI